MWELLASRYLVNQNGAFHSGEAYRVRSSYREHNPGLWDSYCVGGRSARKGLVKMIQNS